MPDETKLKIERHQLKFAEQLKLLEQIKIHRAVIETKPTSKNEIIGFFASKVPFKLTWANLLFVLKSTDIKPNFRCGKGMELNKSRYETTRRIRILTRALYRLYKKFDEEVPVDLQELKEHLDTLEL